MDMARWKSMMGRSISNELPEILIMDILSRLLLPSSKNPMNLNFLRQIKILPQLTISPPDPSYDVIGFDSIGFGFDRKSNDYKVIVLVTCNDCYVTKISQAHLYSLSRNSWKEISRPPPNNLRFGLRNKASTYIDGICYWGVSNFRVNFILSFNTVEEVYSEISLPDSICKLEVHITSIDELVAAIHVLPRELEMDEQSFDLWVLLDIGCSNSWIKKLKIGPILGVARPLMRFWKNDALFLVSDDDELVIFDPYVGELHRSGIKIGCYHAQIICYHESMVSISGKSEFGENIIRQVP
ncbi:hypothetical protein COLO4_11672 [Corchorus olitorius]|uniref:F-box associated beta-propeller type 1 domain-containing protein n=1 Tax=Corchorus olitorius TaxID=93759 RepID=A0A1R3K3M2_9ROSI|nr:hypothetical protein COLO4_11672 [Corchorus olitorius]